MMSVLASIGLSQERHAGRTQVWKCTGEAGQSLVTGGFSQVLLFSHCSFMSQGRDFRLLQLKEFSASSDFTDQTSAKADRKYFYDGFSGRCAERMPSFLLLSFQGMAGVGQERLFSKQCPVCLSCELAPRKRFVSRGAWYRSTTHGQFLQVGFPKRSLLCSVLIQLKLD